MHQKCRKNGHLDKHHTTYSKLIIIFSIHKNTCQFQNLSSLREPTEDVLYIVFTFCRVRWILRVHHKNAQNVFVFGESLSDNGFRVTISFGVCFALHIGVVVFVFRFLFCIFLQCPFLYLSTICTQ